MTAVKTMLEWPDLSAYGMELAWARDPAGRAVLEIRETRPGAAASHEVQLLRLGFQRDRSGPWRRHATRFIPRRFPLHLPKTRIVSLRSPSRPAPPERAGSPTG